MKNLAAVVHYHQGITTIATIMNEALEKELAAIYERFRNHEISREEMNEQIDQLMTTSASLEAHT